LNPGPTA